MTGHQQCDLACVYIAAQVCPEEVHNSWVPICCECCSTTQPIGTRQAVSSGGDPATYTENDCPRHTTLQAWDSTAHRTPHSWRRVPSLWSLSSGQLAGIDLVLYYLDDFIIVACTTTLGRVITRTRMCPGCVQTAWDEVVGRPNIQLGQEGATPECLHARFLPHHSP
jgi:hypothetical protein